MYNRYIPQPDGSFRRSQVPDQHNGKKQNPQHGHPNYKKTQGVPQPERNNTPQVQPAANKGSSSNHNPPKGDLTSLLRKILPSDFDAGDLIVILLLLLMSVDSKEDQTTALLTIVLYLFL